MKIHGIIFIVIILLFLATNVYVFYSFQKTIPLKFMKIILLFMQISSFLMLISTFLFSNHLNTLIISVFYKIGTGYLFILLYMLIICILTDLIRISPLLLKKYFYSDWIGFSIIIFIIISLFTAGYINYTNKKRVEFTIETNKNINDENSLKIVAISDLHLGFNISKNEFSHWIDLINKEEPDLVIIAGDIIDNSVKPLLEQNYAELFSKINTKYGIFAVPGNHEYVAGIEKSVDFFKLANVTCLKDSVCQINNFYIIGRDDKSNNKRKTLNELCRNLDNTKFTILLDHQPINLEESEQNDIDFQFSGHTHDGQMYPIKWITNMMYEKSHGYLKKGNTNYFVSSGIGIWGGKYRVGSRSEFVVVKIKKDNVL